jgi:hypothetical protein
MKPTAQPKFTDQQLEALIRAKFAKSKSASQFKVHVQGGVATIEGKNRRNPALGLGDPHGEGGWRGGGEQQQQGRG